MKSSDAISRSDRALLVALAIVLATASTALGASFTNHPSKDQIALAVPPKAIAAPVQSVDTVSPEPPSDVQSAAVNDAIPEPGVPSQAAIQSVLAEHECLSEAIYFETRGNTDRGQLAVVEVIFNRIKSGLYGASICRVVYQGADRSKTGHCQFPWACNGALSRPREPREWRRAQTLAARVMTGQVQLAGITQGAVGFHAVSVSPNWGPQYVRTVEIGGHIFYRRAGHRTTGI